MPDTPDLDQSQSLDGRRLFTIQEAAQVLRLHPETVSDLIHEGQLGHVPQGRRIMVRQDQLIAYIDARTVDADAAAL
jgi:excisionase family DNA binding protein